MRLGRSENSRLGPGVILFGVIDTSCSDEKGSAGGAVAKYVIKYEGWFLV